MGDGGELLIIIGTERRETERESVCVGKKESVWWKGGCEQEVEVEEREKSIRRKSSDNTAFWWLIDGSLALHTEGRVTGFCIGSTADPEVPLPPRPTKTSHRRMVRVAAHGRVHGQAESGKALWSQESTLGHIGNGGWCWWRV
ncbi:hypothetical protein CISG_02792 [Coccidioides immitis RMSCC 3703]|uniref:Uncharacterized protein n=2 Tax=Coccidioides immitis TaxID=5501 RepID=A0A0J8R9M4_COCIT|nr:hypothetical protein CIRG_00278 [Coccidioides immitis RMSCC 2394]KMU81774.1 hypothetical protein CISG_02792 [Coccidioides immitis RMSCC 3703]